MFGTDLRETHETQRDPRSDVTIRLTPRTEYLGVSDLVVVSQYIYYLKFRCLYT